MRATRFPQVPVSDFRVLGGSIYATAPGAMGLSWKGESMWMPRVSGAYTLGERTVIKGGYGLFYDTLNAGDYTGFNQLGYSSATTNASSTDFGRSWLLGDPVNGISPLVDPFPVRVGGGRFEDPIEDALGVDAILGTSFTREDPNREHPRVQRWRIGVQRELVRNSRSRSPTPARTRTASADQHRGIYMPGAVLQQRDERPRCDAAVAAAAAGDEPVQHRQLRLAGDDQPGAVSARMAGNAFFTATTTQRQNLLRAYPQLVGLDLRQPAARRSSRTTRWRSRDPPLFGAASAPTRRSPRAG